MRMYLPVCIDFINERIDRMCLRENGVRSPESHRPRLHRDRTGQTPFTVAVLSISFTIIRRYNNRGGESGSAV